MKTKWPGKTFLIIALFLGLIAVLLVFVPRFFRQEQGLTGADWEGIWETTYFYEHEQSLLYEGTLHLSFQNAPAGHLEVQPPQSTRKEILPLEELSVSDDARMLSGILVHSGYKINGGFLRESFELDLEDPVAFSGRGECLEFCAEGTDGQKIFWQGSRVK